MTRISVRFFFFSVGIRDSATRLGGRPRGYARESRILSLSLSVSGRNPARACVYPRVTPLPPFDFTPIHLYPIYPGNIPEECVTLISVRRDASRPRIDNLSVGPSRMRGAFRPRRRPWNSSRLEFTVQQHGSVLRETRGLEVPPCHRVSPIYPRRNRDSVGSEKGCRI